MWDEASSGINFPYELTPRNLSWQKSGVDEEVPALRRSINRDTNKKRKTISLHVNRWSQFAHILNAGANTQTIYTYT